MLLSLWDACAISDALPSCVIPSEVEEPRGGSLRLIRGSLRLLPRLRDPLGMTRCLGYLSKSGRFLRVRLTACSLRHFAISA